MKGREGGLVYRAFSRGHEGGSGVIVEGFFFRF